MGPWWSVVVCPTCSLEFGQVEGRPTAGRVCPGCGCTMDVDPPARTGFRLVVGFMRREVERDPATVAVFV